MRLHALLLSLATGTSLWVSTPGALAEPPATEPPVASTRPPSTLLAKTSPAVRYANLSPGQCRTELARQKLPVKRSGGTAKGIATPVRVAGPFGTVTFITPGAKSVYGMLDCRLSLALLELSRVLERHGVVAVHVDNLYRPRAHLPGKRHKRSQHAYGLAIDIMGFTLADGRKLVIEEDWGAVHGDPPCATAPGAALPEPARLLREIVCDVARAEIFHHMLTPNYDRAHANHLHFDVQRGEKSQIVR